MKITDYGYYYRVKLVREYTYKREDTIYVLKDKIKYKDDLQTLLPPTMHQGVLAVHEIFHGKETRFICYWDRHNQIYQWESKYPPWCNEVKDM